VIAPVSFPTMRTTSALLLLTLICCPLRAAETSTSPDKKLPGISDQMRSFIEKKEITGAITLVADKNGIIHFDVVGTADVAGMKPMTPDSIFWIASMTKPITATGILMLQDEGKLSVDDLVSKHIPEFANLKTPSGKPANLTLKHLLTHTSGLREAPTEVAKDAKVLADLIPSFLEKPTSFEPGSKWSYCQSGINTLGRIIEVVSGKSYVEFIQTRLLDPLGMKDTTFYLSAEQLPRLAPSYKKDAGTLVEMPIAFLMGKSPTDKDRYPLANGGLFSTAQDYAKFLRMVLNKGTLDGKRYLSEKAVEQMTTIQSGDVVTGFTPGNGWGLGWCVVKEPQGITASLSPGSHGHGGAYGTQAWIDPKRGIAYVLLIQRAGINADGSEMRKAFHDATVAAMK
jgi:CubicO group peptidase (beta-lactamase class C family)